MYLMLLSLLFGAASASPLPVRHAAVVAAVARDPRLVAEHLQKARQALEAGALETARLEYVIAAALDRDAGRLPVSATMGLVQVLFSQDRYVDAAAALDRLADDAAAAGDHNVEAKALADAVWMHHQSRNRTAKQRDAVRLLDLLKGTSLNDTTRTDIASRYRW